MSAMEMALEPLAGNAKLTWSAWVMHDNLRT